jgi:hypothetical protein
MGWKIPPKRHIRKTRIVTLTPGPGKIRASPGGMSHARISAASAHGETLETAWDS